MTMNALVFTACIADIVVAPAGSLAYVASVAIAGKSASLLSLLVLRSRVCSVPPPFANSSRSSQTLKFSCASAGQATVVRPISSVSLESFPCKHGASSQSQRLSRQPRQSLSITRRLQQNESSGLLRSGNLEKEGSFWMALKTSVLSVICHSHTNTPEFRLPGWAALKCPSRTPNPGATKHRCRYSASFGSHTRIAVKIVSKLNNSSQSSKKRALFFMCNPGAPRPLP